MSLFDPEFYPTPDAVIAKMIEPYGDILSTATILEPSAGSGAIVDYITTKGLKVPYTTKRGETLMMDMTAKKEKIYTCEHNPELQLILQGKGYRIVADDFLSYRPDTRFNLALMNPPFASGAKHLLHAWDILQSGDIACLLNAETVRNVCTKERERLKAIIAENGSVEYLGPVFRTADNPTDVDVALVRLHKEAKEDPFRIDLDGFVKENMPDFGSMTTEEGALAQSNRLDAFIRSWDMAKAAAINYLKARKMLQLYMSAFEPKDNRYTTNVVATLEKYLQDNPNAPLEDAYNNFVEEGKWKAWNMIFTELNLGKYMTSALRDKFLKFRDSQASMALTKENIMKFFQFIMFNLSDIMDHNVSDVYDMFTRFYDGNTSCTEGWKTNKRYKANRKVIIPYCVDAGFMPQKYGYDAYYSVSSSFSQNLDDIDKAMCWLSGRNYDTLDTERHYGSDFRSVSGPNHSITAAITTIRVGDQDWHESAFFRLKAFKKGTLHLEFKDEALWAKFNQVVNKEKNLVGDTEAA